ncbi:MAG TPA: hypothetical protein VJT50_05265, partial [Pyrinomonadaceae bacterium]|nr:hypothetical protein [Pyrinomonadaceae bacterium]
FTISPNDFGLEAQPLEKFRGGGPAENARIIRGILNRDDTGSLVVARDLVIANAAAALRVAGLATDLCQAAALARESIETGGAASKLDALIRETNRT